MFVFTNPDTAANFEPAFGDDQPVQRITVIKQYSGPITGISPEAAETYIKQGGNLIKRKTAAPIAKQVEEEE